MARWMWAICFAPVAAAVPLEVHHQGRLLDAQGRPLDGTHDVDVVLFDSPSGGDLLTETSVSTPLQDGYFTATLSPDDTDLAGDVWVEIRLANVPLGPRVRLGSVPYARIAHGVSGGPVNATSVSINGTPVISATGQWVGSPTGLVGPQGPQGLQGPAGPQGPAGATGGAYPRSCKALLDANGALLNQDGLYNVDLDGDDVTEPVYCDMTTDGGGWTLVSYGYAAVSGTNTGNHSHYSLKCGGGAWNPTTRTQTAALRAVELARRSTFMLLAFKAGSVATGNIQSYDRSYKFGIPTPKGVTFDNHSYAAPSYAATGPCVPVTVTQVHGGTFSATRYTRIGSLGGSWTDTFPTTYGATDSNTCAGSALGPAVSTRHTGSHYSHSSTPATWECDISGGATQYNHLGNYYHNTNNNFGSSSIWFK
jgi:hypothetical protein